MKTRTHTPLGGIRAYRAGKDVAPLNPAELNGFLNQRLASAVALQAERVQNHKDNAGPDSIGLRELADQWRWLVEAYAQSKR